MRKSVSIIIPNYNGKHLLEKNLPSVIAAAAAYGAAELIIVDDASSDGSAEWLVNEYPSQAKLVKREKNGGFQHAVASGVAAAAGELLYFLNSDIRVSEDFLAPVAEHFSDPSVFAVSSLAYDNEGVEISGGRSGLHWRWWKPDVDRGARHTPSGISPGPTLFASGGHSAYRADEYRRLGGFDTVFSPFYWEDVDLCLRAWRLGMKVLFDPRSVVYHDHQKSIGSAYSKKKVAAIRMRNHLLFAWRNMDSAAQWASHIAGLALIMIKSPQSVSAAAGHIASVRAIRGNMKRDGLKKSFSDISEMLAAEYYSTPGVFVIHSGDKRNVKKLDGRVEMCRIQPGAFPVVFVRVLRGYLSSSRRFDEIRASGATASAARALALLFRKKLSIESGT